MPPFMSADTAATRAPTLPTVSRAVEIRAPKTGPTGLLAIATVAATLVGFGGLAAALLPHTYAAVAVGAAVVLLWRLAVKVAPAATERDAQTTQWLADLRDPNHVPIGGSWVGTDWGDRCAVGWLLERTDGQWRNELDKVSHTAYRAVCGKYGQRLITDVIAMNDRGVPWTVIADRVEHRTRRLGRRL